MTRCELNRIIKAAQQASYRVSAGDTLSGIAQRYGTTVPVLSRLNGLRDPNRIRTGQQISLPVSQGQQNETPVQLKPLVGLNAVSTELHKAFNNPNLEAAMLANINRETGGTFDYRTWQKGYNNGTLALGQKQNGGYGLFQYTGDSLTGYKSWLAKNKLADSATNQIGYMKSVYGPSRSGWSANTASGSGLSREQLADWWHRRVETPAHTIEGNKYYSPAKTLYYTLQHNRFMKNAIKSVNGVWQSL